MRDILPNFFLKAIQLFNMRDPTSTLTTTVPDLLPRALDATFDASQKGLLTEVLARSSTDPGTVLLNQTPHERAVLLTQALAGALFFLHRLADAQWPHDVLLAPYTLTPGMVTRQLDEIRQGRERREVLDAVEASTIFSTCTLRKGVADLIVEAVGRADRVREGAAGNQHYGAARGIVVEDDQELQEISLSFVNDKGPDEAALPCGLTILPLT
jgi:hypothetical protein